MAQADQEQIVFGPGGRILDENEELLSQLLNTPVLLPEELLKLAEFYKAYPANVPLGNHLALLALATREGELVSQKVFTEYGDPTEDSAEGTSPHHEPPEDELVLLSVRRVPVSGIGLLIETLDFKTDSGATSFHYVIGVSPAPDSLPESKP